MLRDVVKYRITPARIRKKSHKNDSCVYFNKNTCSTYSTYVTPTVPSAHVHKAKSLASQYTGLNLPRAKANSFQNGNVAHVGQYRPPVQKGGVNPGKVKHCYETTAELHGLDITLHNRFEVLNVDQGGSVLHSDSRDLQFVSTQIHTARDTDFPLEKWNNMDSKDHLVNAMVFNANSRCVCVSTTHADDKKFVGDTLDFDQIIQSDNPKSQCHQIHCQEYHICMAQNRVRSY